MFKTTMPGSCLFITHKGNMKLWLISTRYCNKIVFFRAIILQFYVANSCTQYSVSNLTWVFKIPSILLHWRCPLLRAGNLVQSHGMSSAVLFQPHIISVNLSLLGFRTAIAFKIVKLESENKANHHWSSTINHQMMIKWWLIVGPLMVNGSIHYFKDHEPSISIIYHLQSSEIIIHHQSWAINNSHQFPFDISQTDFLTILP